MSDRVYGRFKIDSEVGLTMQLSRIEGGIFKEALARTRRIAKHLCRHFFTQGMMHMTISVGDKLPDVTMVKATADGPEKVQASEYFAGKTVALFSVPGAFTPTCSAKHLPGFVEKAAELKSKGVDEIVGTAVNDAFVMGAWNSASGSADITMLADGNGDFAEGVGLTMDGSGFGLGKRGQRYSMIVKDGVVQELNVEAPGDFSVSSAEHMLGQL